MPGVAIIILAFVAPGQAGLYSPDEPLVSLAGAARSLLLGSRSAWLAEFYASWCGHCAAFKPTWSALARDVEDWRPAIYMGVIDCAEESNRQMCSEFDITGYPTVKFFRSFAGNISDGIRMYPSSIQEMKQYIINRLEEQRSSPSSACPPLDPISNLEVDQFFQNNKADHLAVIFENPGSFIGREVTLDMVQYKGVSVRRALSDQIDLIIKFKVTSFPSGYVLSRDGSIRKINVKEESRAEYVKFLRSLSGVKRGNEPIIGWSETYSGRHNVVRLQADRSKVYMADLESALHYTLRVEVARFKTLEGTRLKALTNYVSALKKYFPARPLLGKLLNSLHSWLRSRSGTKVSYQDFEDVLNNKEQDQNAVLSSDVLFVGCQGSKPEFRGFPCSLWTLFHVLLVQASELSSQGRMKPGPREVLMTMRGYVKNFFGCRECAQHFEGMAQESMNTVSSLDEAIMWLWDRHNRVNKRLSGAASEDPEFPKVQWPTPELCPLCQIEEEGEEGEDHVLNWDLPNVLHFLKSHFGKENLSEDYLEDEDVLLEKQQQAHDDLREAREKREAAEEETKEENPGDIDDIQLLIVRPGEDIEKRDKDSGEIQIIEARLEGEDSEKQDKSIDEIQNTQVKAEDGEKSNTNNEELQNTPAKIEEYEEEKNNHELKRPERVEDVDQEEGDPSARSKKASPHEIPSITKTNLELHLQDEKERKDNEDMLDSDSFARSLLPGRSLQDSRLHENNHVLQAQVLLDIPEEEFDHIAVRKRLLKRGVDPNYIIGVVVKNGEVNWRGRWVKMLEVGFSRLDISLCVLFYFLSSMCLLFMYFYLNLRTRCLRKRHAFPVA
ncbi:sulfhydryl oxidase 1 [Rhinophrynus dorsalis]